MGGINHLWAMCGLWHCFTDHYSKPPEFCRFQCLTFAPSPGDHSDPPWVWVFGWTLRSPCGTPTRGKPRSGSFCNLMGKTHHRWFELGEAIWTGARRGPRREPGQGDWLDLKCPRFNVLGSLPHSSNVVAMDVEYDWIFTGDLAITTWIWQRVSMG